MEFQVRGLIIGILWYFYSVTLTHLTPQNNQNTLVTRHQVSTPTLRRPVGLTSLQSNHSEKRNQNVCSTIITRLAGSFRTLPAIFVVTL